jgi:hypothetical protein
MSATKFVMRIVRTRNTTKQLLPGQDSKVESAVVCWGVVEHDQTSPKLLLQQINNENCKTKSDII